MADIYVYGAIGDHWGEDDMTASRFVKELAAAKGEDITVHINSGGGDVFDANAMAETLHSYKGHTTASIEGLAASAASYFALTADEVVMNPSALFMVHNPWTFCQGNAEDMRDAADFLDKVGGTICSQYAKKTGMGADEIAGLMAAETWMDASEALEMGFVDSISDAEPVKAEINGDILSRFKHAPQALADTSAAPETGDTASIIEEETSDDEPTTEAVEGAAGAAAKVACIHGQFLTY